MRFESGSSQSLESLMGFPSMEATWWSASICPACKKSFSKTLPPAEYEGRRRMPALRQRGGRTAHASLLSDLRERVHDGGKTRSLDADRLALEVRMQIQEFSFGSIRIDGTIYDHDVVIEGGDIRERKKKPSKKFRDDFGHTPLSVQEDIPWTCRRLVIGAGAYGRLPVMTEVKREAERRKVELLIVPTAQAIEELQQDTKGTNAILHLTC